MDRGKEISETSFNITYAKVLVGFVFMVMFVGFSGFVSAVVNITVNPANITLTGSGSVNFTFINTTVNNSTLITTVGPKIYELYVPIFSTNTGITFEITDTDVLELRLNGSSAINTPFIFKINNTVIRSWNGTGIIFNPAARGYIVLGSSTTGGGYINNLSLTGLGNSTSNRNGLDIRGSNYTITNSNFSYNYAGLKFISGSGTQQNVLVRNNNFWNNTYGMFFSGDNILNMSIENNKFYGWNTSDTTSPAGGINFEVTANPKVIKNNIFDVYTWSVYIRAFDGTSSGQFLIQNNTFRYHNFSDGERYNTREIEVNNGSNINITGNFCEFSEMCLRLKSDNGPTKIIYVENNEVNNSDWPFAISDLDQLYIKNNRFNNNTFNYDTYNMGIGTLRNTTNSIVSGNIVTQILSQGIHVHRSANITIYNNTWSFIPVSQKLTRIGHDSGYPSVAIQLTPDYRSWLNDNIVQTEAQYANWNNTNINVTGNIFDENTQAFLVDSGTANLIQDLNNYRFRSLWYPNNFIYRTDFYFNNTIANYTVSDRVNNTATLILTNYIANAYRTGNVPQNGNKEICSFFFTQGNYIRIINVNTTDAFTNTLTNISSPTIYNSTLSTGTWLSNSYINLTLQPNAETYIGDASWT